MSGKEKENWESVQYKFQLIFMPVPVVLVLFCVIFSYYPIFADFLTVRRLL